MKMQTEADLKKKLNELGYADADKGSTPEPTETPTLVLEKKDEAIVLSPDKPETEVPPKPAEELPQTQATTDKQVEELTAKLAASESKLAELQAKMDRQSGDYGGNLDKLRNQMRELNAAYEALKAEHETLKVKPNETPPPPEKVVSDDLRETFPKDAEAIDKTIAYLRERLAKVEGMVTEGTSQSKRAEQGSLALLQARFNEELYSKAPDFDSVNLLPEWKAFLETPDKYGRSLLPELQAAWGRHDPKPIIAAIADFKAGTKREPTVEEKAAEDKAKADKAAKLKAEAAPTAAAGTKKTEAQNDAAQLRKARIAAYKAKMNKDHTTVTVKEMEQYQADSEAEMKAKLAEVGLRA